MSLDLSAVATSLLSSLASDTFVKLKRVEGKSKDPVTGLSQGGTEQIINLTAAVISAPSSLDDETRIELGDRVVIMDNKTTPLMDDIVIIPDASNNEIEYRMVDIDGFNHAGIQQYWQVTCRA